MPLPKNVFRIKRGQKAYYYHQPNRHRPKAERGMLTRIPYEPSHPEFWNMAAELNGAVVAASAGSFKSTIQAYKDSPAWSALSEGTRETYTVYLKRIESAWGCLKVADLTVPGITTLRDAMAASTPSAANMMLKVLKAFLSWAYDKGMIGTNLARGVRSAKVQIRKTTPWPENVWQAAYENGPEDVSRLAFLGRKSGQRISDMVRMGPANLDGDKLRFTIKKRRMIPHVVTLMPEDAAVIRSWKTHWFVRHSGEKHNEESLRQALYAWLGEDEEASEIKPHGLRALAVCDARFDGITHQQIATLFGMSIAMVQSYSALIDKELQNDETQGARAKNKRKTEN